MSSGDLEKSLRADIESYVSNRLGAFKEEVERLRGQLNDALTRLSERMDEPVSGDAPVAVAVAEHLRNARNLGIEAAATESSRARASSDIALIKAAVDELEGRQTQADVLNALVNRVIRHKWRLDVRINCVTLNYRVGQDPGCQPVQVIFTVDTLNVIALPGCGLFQTLDTDPACRLDQIIGDGVSHAGQ